MLSWRDKQTYFLGTPLPGAFTRTEIHKLRYLFQADISPQLFKYGIGPDYHTGFSKLLEKLVVKYPADKDYKKDKKMTS